MKPGHTEKKFITYSGTKTTGVTECDTPWPMWNSNHYKQQMFKDLCFLVGWTIRTKTEHTLTSSLLCTQGHGTELTSQYPQKWPEIYNKQCSRGNAKYWAE